MSNLLHVYIVRPIGTAGCVLASRLSEDPNITVLLIEAGQRCASQDARFVAYEIDRSLLHSHDQNLFTRIPLAFSKLFKTAFDWNYETTYATMGTNRPCHWLIDIFRPQKAFNGRAIYWPRGKMLGGTR